MAEERKEKIIRVLQILQETDQKSPVNATKIVDKLENEFTIGKTERRSIYRDVKLLQSCGYAIKQSKDKKKGWYMDRHAFDDWEIKVMMDAVQQTKCVSAKEAMEIKEKLLSLTSKRGRSRFTHLMSFSPNNAETDYRIGEYIELMIEALYTGKKIEFQYTEVNSKLQKVLRRNGEYYRLNAYAIYWADNTYYIIGAHDQHEGLTHYRLDRVLNMRIHEDSIVPASEKIGVNPELTIREHIDKSVNHFLGDLIRIEIEYIPNQVSNAILYDFCGDDVKVREQSNGKCLASFRKMNSITLVEWFVRHCNRFKVVAPTALREEVVNNLRKGLEGYE